VRGEDLNRKRGVFGGGQGDAKDKTVEKVEQESSWQLDLMHKTKKRLRFKKG